MGMTIDLAMNNLSGILTEATEDEDSVCYVTEDDAETLQVVINTMYKYQKIAQIVKDWIDDDSVGMSDYWMGRVKEVVEDGRN